MGFAILCTGVAKGLVVEATFSSPKSVPISAAEFTASGKAVNFLLLFEPETGTPLTVIENTGISFISGEFTNLDHGEIVWLSFNQENYRFVANYYGGTGNDLVLQWARQEIRAWGYNHAGQLGNGSDTVRDEPIPMIVPGLPTGKIVTQISAGLGYSLAVCSDGTVVAWGRNHHGQLGNGTKIDSGTARAIEQTGALAGKTVVAVSAGSSHSLALCDDGTVAVWGANFYGQLGIGTVMESGVPILVSEMGSLAGKTVVAVSAGGNHSVALCSDGTLAAWGDNYEAQVGLSASSLFITTPVVVPQTGALSDKTITAISAGGNHTLALCSDGSVGAWGMNEMGQLGDGTVNLSSMIVEVTTSGALSGKTVVAVEAGFYHSLALCSDGSVMAWGSNRDGQLGTGSPQSSMTPAPVYQDGMLAGKTVQTISAGYYHNLLKCSDGTVASWGWNDNYQLGDGIAGSSAIPVPVSRAAGLAESSAGLLVAGHSHNHIVRTDNTMLSWGDNGDGQLANGIMGSARLPVSVNQSGILAGKTVLSMAAGFAHSIALCSDGTLAAWGLNEDGQLGNGTFSDSTDPIGVDQNGVLSGKTVVAVSAGLAHSLALCSDGTVFAWGINSSGQLGDGTTTRRSVPVAVGRTGLLHGKVVVAVAAGDYHNLALCDDGTVAAWGSNLGGGLGDGSSIATSSLRSAPVAVDQTGVLMDKTIVAVAAGEFHSLALCSDGTVATWGSNTYLQLGAVPSLPWSGLPVMVSQEEALAGKFVVGIAAGSNHSLALCSDGEVVAWGGNVDGQLGTATETWNHMPVAVNSSGILSGRKVVRITTKFNHSLGVCSDGTVVAWGGNRHGQLGNGTSAATEVPVAVDPGGAVADRLLGILVAGGQHSLGMVPSPHASDSALSNLAVDGGWIAPSFHPDITVYSAVVGNLVSAVRFLTVASNSRATVIVDGTEVISGMSEAQFDLNEDEAVISVKVLANDGSSETVYRLLLKRGSYESWMGRRTESPDPGRFADPDHDGVPNLLEYVLAGDPAARDPMILPAFSLNSSHFHFDFFRRIESTVDTRLLFQYSNNLSDWSEIEIGNPLNPEIRYGTVDEAGNQRVSITVDRGNHQRMFGRVEAIPKQGGP